MVGWWMQNSIHPQPQVAGALAADGAAPAVAAAAHRRGALAPALPLEVGKRFRHFSRTSSSLKRDFNHWKTEIYHDWPSGVKDGGWKIPAIVRQLAMFDFFMDWFKGNKYTENPIFHHKIHGFRLRFSLQPIRWGVTFAIYPAIVWWFNHRKRIKSLKNGFQPSLETTFEKTHWDLDFLDHWRLSRKIIQPKGWGVLLWGHGGGGPRFGGGKGFPHGNLVPALAWSRVWWLLHPKTICFESVQC